MKDQLQFLKGVGPARLKNLQKLNIRTLTDLIYYFPRAYSQIKHIRIADLLLHLGEQVVLSGQIMGTAETRRGRIGAPAVTTVVLSDTSGHCRCVWFNQPYIAEQIPQGRVISILGRYNAKYRTFAVDEHIKDGGTFPGIRPQYALTDGLSASQLANIIQTGLLHYDFPEILPKSFRSRYNLVGIRNALTQIHQPESMEMLEEARYRLKFEELFIYQLAFRFWRLRKRTRDGKPLAPFQGFSSLVKAKFGFDLTPDQQQAIAEISTDLEQNTPMNRLLQGDVGSGKTLVAFYTLLTAVVNGYKSVLMAPTEILAQQHYANMLPIAQGLNMKLVLLTASTAQQRQREIHQQLLDSEPVIIIGTHAVFQDKVSIAKLAVVVTDEQHRFGVLQRLALTEKAQNPHVLVMSATPIPRTTAMSLYGDLDLSMLEHKPAGRQEIVTRVVLPTKRNQVFEFALKQISSGNSGYIVCPLIEQSERIAALSLEEYSSILCELLPDWVKIAQLHGKMSARQKEAAIDAFKNGDAHLLLATTVVEVGVDVSNATFIIIESSERFGLAQLHQLRGRVGRNEKRGYCFFLTANSDLDRLKVLEDSQDGYEISMADMKLRGPGQLLGQRQHGLNEFRLADIVADHHIANLCRQAADLVVESLETECQWQLCWEVIIKKIQNLNT